MALWETLPEYYADISQTTYIWIGDYFEDQRTHRRLVISRPFDFSAFPQVGAFHRRDVTRRGQVIDDCIQHQLDAFISQ